MISSLEVIWDGLATILYGVKFVRWRDDMYARIWYLPLSITYNSLEVNQTRDGNAQARTHTQRHMNNAWREIVSCSPSCTFYCFSFFLGSYKQYEITLIPLGPVLWPHSNMIVSQASFTTFLLTMNNLRLHLQHHLCQNNTWIDTSFTISKFMEISLI